MNFEKKILSKFKSKKVLSPKEKVDDGVKKITYVAFIVITIFIFTQLKDDTSISKDIESGAEKNIESIDVRDNDEIVKVGQGKIKQNTYTIVSNDFLNKTINDDFIYINITSFKNDKIYEKNIIDNQKTILEFDYYKYIDDFEFLDISKKYIIFVKNIADIKNIKNDLMEKGFEEIYFNII